MNYIDLIVYITLIVAIINGWRRGMIVQICSLLGILCGIYLATKYGATVGGWLHIGEDYTFAGGFLVVLVVVLIGVGVVSHLIKGLFKFVGLGIVDTILGIVLSVCKFMLILSVLFSTFNLLNGEFSMVSKETIASSRCYKPLVNLSDKIFPALTWTQKQINSGLEKL